MKLNDTLMEHLWQDGIFNNNIEDLLISCFVIIDDIYKKFVPMNIQNRQGPNSLCPDSVILAICWTGELIGFDSENALIAFVKKNFSYLFPFIPERSRFNRRRRNLWKVTDMIVKRF